MRTRFSAAELAKLAAGIRGMSRGSALYKLLKSELTARGNWRLAARGRPGWPKKGKYD
jgi:hypothetical protein